VHAHRRRETSTYPPDAKLLILNCADLGFCHASTVGVYDALREGIGTSASLIVPPPWARESASRFRGDDVGVRLTLNAEHDLYRWGPITQAPVASSTATAGFPRTVTDVWDHADLDEVRRECRAQVERAVLWGFDISHLDAHLDALLMRPEFFDVYLELAVDFALPLRAPQRRGRSPTSGFPVRQLAAAEGVLFADRYATRSPRGTPPGLPRPGRRPRTGTHRGQHCAPPSTPRSCGPSPATGRRGWPTTSSWSPTAASTGRSSEAGVTLIGYRPLRDAMRRR
jgi:predicted glycoside hydrolase/deacetylase ChbG (UPF0249 family)